MKYVFLKVVVFGLLNMAMLCQAQKFTIVPNHPKPGDVISVFYRPEGSLLKNSNKITMIVHTYGKGVNGYAIYYTNEIVMKKKGQTWEGKIIAADSISGEVIRFTNGKNEDNNGSMCYPIRLYNNRGQFVKYASEGLVGAYNELDVLRNISPGPTHEQNLALLDEEFKLYPDLEKEYLLLYYSHYKKVNKEKAIAFLKNKAEMYEKQNTSSYEDLDYLINIYIFQNDVQKLNKIKEVIYARYPNSVMASRFVFTDSLANLEEGDEKLKIAQRFRERFPKSDLIPILFPEKYKKLMAEKKYEQAFEAIKEKPKPSSNDYNDLSWTMYVEKANLPLAKEMAFEGIKLIDKEIKTKLSKRPAYYSQREYEKELKANYAKEIIDTYGVILLKLGKKEEALKYESRAYVMFNGDEPEVNERYAEALLANGKTKMAKDVIEACVSKGKTTAAMKDMLKEL